MPQASYSHQRSSLFVKLIANLHCFVPDICKEQERNLFIHKFLECLQMDPSRILPDFSFTSDVKKAATVCRNLRSLLSHAESLIPIFLNEEDVQLLRVFVNQLQSLTSIAEVEENRVHEDKFEESTSWEKLTRPDIQEEHLEAESTRGCLSTLHIKEPLKLDNKVAHMKETVSENSAFRVENQSGKADESNEQNKGKSSMEKDVHDAETSGSDTNYADQMDNGDFPKSRDRAKESGSGRLQEDEKAEPIEKQRRKRKRTIMNDKQMAIIERALLDEPDMQRHGSLIRSWAEKLSYHGSEITASQLRNWLNNRKARLARLAAKEMDNAHPDRQGGAIQGSTYDSPESPEEEFYTPQTKRGTRSTSRTDNPETSNRAEKAPEVEVGQNVMLVDNDGVEIGKGKVYQSGGEWCGRSLEESGTCVVDIDELVVEGQDTVMYPSEGTGETFVEAEMKFGVMRVLWDLRRVLELCDQS